MWLTRCIAWTIANLTYTNSQYLETIVASGALPFIMFGLRIGSSDILAPCLQAIASLSGYEQNASIIAGGKNVLLFVQILQKKEPQMIRESCSLILVNIAKHGIARFTARKDGTIPALIECLKDESDIIRQNAIRALALYSKIDDCKVGSH